MANEYRFILSLGSNIFPEKNLPKAIRLLQKLAQIEMISSTWETPAIGAQGPNFLNLALAVCCTLPPDEFKTQISRRIEAHLGRVRSEDKNAPRTIDIDILAVDGKIIDGQIWENAHLAVPVSELDPDLVDPASGLRISSIAQQLSERQPIKLRQDLNNKLTRNGTVG